MPIEKFKFEITDEELFSAHWESDGARFHVWIDVNGDLINGTIYKNPPRHTPYEGEGWFNTRHLDANAKSNIPLVDEIKRRIQSGNLIDRARKEKAAADFIRQRQQTTREIAAYRHAFVTAAIALGRATGNEDEKHFALHLAQHVGTLSPEAIHAFGRAFVADFKERVE